MVVVADNTAAFRELIAELDDPPATAPAPEIATAGERVETDQLADQPRVHRPPATQTMLQLATGYLHAALTPTLVSAQEGTAQAPLEQRVHPAARRSLLNSPIVNI